MARKEMISREFVLDNTFEMIREQGFEEVTARKLAHKLGCSTQPIFRLYSGMSELLEDTYPIAVEYFHQFIKERQDNNKIPFIDLGLSYIEFATEEQNLFKLLFMSEYRAGKEMYDLLNSEYSFVTNDIKKATESGCQQSSELFMKLWIFIHGIACMCLTGDYDLTMDETVALLKDSYYAYF